MSQAEVQTLIEKFASFAGDMTQRVENLEKHACKVDTFLFVDTEERPSLSTIIPRIDRHIGVMCDYAKLTKWAAIVIGSLGGAAGGIFGILKLLEHFQ